MAYLQLTAKLEQNTCSWRVVAVVVGAVIVGVGAAAVVGAVVVVRVVSVAVVIVVITGILHCSAHCLTQVSGQL